MLLLNRDDAARLLRTCYPPFKGTWKTLPSFLLPQDVAQDSLNTTVLGGKLRSRCGLKRFNNQKLNEPIIGSFLTIDTTNSRYPILSTPTTVYRLTNTWHNITGNVNLSASSTIAKLTSIQIGTQVYVLYCNGIDTIKMIPQTTYQLTDIIPHAGSLPVFTDICTSFARVIGITPPYTVGWCDVINDSYLSITNWPALNQAILSDTEDSLVAIKPLGTLGIVIYKEANIFVGFGQSGSNAAAFRFEHRGEYEGPASPRAIVNVNGNHIYMTPTGRVGLFDGTNQSWLCDGIWPYLQNNLDSRYKSKIFGVYSYKTSEVTFWYPRVGDNGVCKGMLTIIMPYPTAGVTSYSYFPGITNFACSDGLSVRYYNGTTHPLIFDTLGQTFELDNDTYTDAGYDFPCSLSTGLFKPDNSPDDYEDIYFPIFELYATRGHNQAGYVDVSALVSNLLENDGNQSTPERIDLSQIPINEFVAYKDTLGSFLGARFDWLSSSRFELKALDIYGLKAGI